MIAVKYGMCSTKHSQNNIQNYKIAWAARIILNMSNEVDHVILKLGIASHIV